MRQPTGWRQTSSLNYGALLELASDERAIMTDAEEVWRTRQAGIGFLGERNVEVGRCGDLRDGHIQQRPELSDTADFAGVEDFNWRHSEQKLIDKWSYKCAVYNLEVEDFDTYYVGEFGVWVHSTNLVKE